MLAIVCGFVFPEEQLMFPAEDLRAQTQGKVRFRDGQTGSWCFVTGLSQATGLVIRTVIIRIVVAQKLDTRTQVVIRW